MKMLSKIKLLIIIGCLFVATNAWAGNYTCRINNLGILEDFSAKAKILGNESPAFKAAKEAYHAAEDKMVALCEQANDAFVWLEDYKVFIKPEELFAKMVELNIYEDFKAAQYAMKKAIADLREFKASENACGENYPEGCPTGQYCYFCEKSIGGLEHDGATYSHYECAVENPCGFLNRSSIVANSNGQGSRLVQQAGTASAVIDTNADGETRTGLIGIGSDMKSIEDLWKDVEIVNPRSNASFCNIKSLKDSYMNNCYSCTIVAVMINTFLTVADKTAPLTQEAGVKLMIIGMFLWIAFYVLKQIATLVAPEPMIVVQDLLKFLFKCLIAYTLITSGLGVISKMIVDPILGFGAEYGNIVIDSATPEVAELNKYGDFDVKEYNSDLISADVFGKIMRLSKKADAAVSLNFVIGDALTCHAHHAGAITIAKKVQDMVGIEFYFPNIWLWLCGIAIWVMGLMVVIGINFYLLDLSFKVGFGLLALPITLGLMPFDKFQDKFTACIKIIVNAAGTFMFLGITVGVSVVLISAGLGGTDELFHAIETDNKRYVAEQFSFTGAKFLLVAFAFLYSHKLISETVSKLTSKFFDSVTGSLNHMHTMAVGTTSYLGNAVKDKVGGTVGRITKGIGKGVDNLTAGALGAAAKGLRRGGRAIGRRFGKSGGSE